MRRGIVLSPEDFSLSWPALAGEMGLNVVGLHGGYGVESVEAFVTSPAGQEALEDFARRGIDVEYELHAMGDLLPRSLFDEEPELFRMDGEGVRQRKGNLCVSNPRALQIVANQAASLARRLRPTTHRYFLWMDDGEGLYCQCPRCRDIAPPDQCLLVLGPMLEAIRAQADPQAQLAYLAYCETIHTPTLPIPEGIFLEYAPYRRKWDRPLADPACEENVAHLKALESLLRVFPVDTAHVLEYWVDCSLFSGYKKPPKAIPLLDDVLRADIALYTGLGIRSITSFGVYVDAQYRDLHGLDALYRYGRLLAEAR